MFFLDLSDQLPDVLLQEFYFNSMSLICLCIQNNYNVLISKIIANFSQDICVLANLLLQKIGFQKKSKFSLSLKFNLLFFFKCRLFFLLLDYFCSEVIILTLFLVNILHSFFLIYLFNERFETVWDTGYIKQSFYYNLEYYVFKNQSLVSLC